jgi:hypothetical protein
MKQIEELVHDIESRVKALDRLCRRHGVPALLRFTASRGSAIEITGNKIEFFVGRHLK